jgi:DNA-binding NtrC family response regulator
MAPLHQLHEPESPLLIAEGPAMVALLARAAFFAKLRDPVLLGGPTGTGKSTLARWIHDHGPRASRPFVHVNCGALPGSLFASEVFGHVRGAFTGASQDAPGLARAAQGGTLFLDEIGEVRPEDQRKLLTFFDTERVRPVGSAHSHPVDVRILLATHRDLQAEPSFREDLRYRIEALRLTLPSLVQRPEDLPALVRHLVARGAERNGLARLRVTAEALAELACRDWPGNVRQLRQVLLEALVAAHLEESPRIEARHLGAGPAGPTWTELRDRYQGAVVAEALRESHGDRTKAAKRLGMSVSRLYDVLKREGVG